MSAAVAARHRSRWMLVAAAVGACAARSPEGIEGTYAADHRFGVEELVLARDGAFTQRITLKSTGLTCETKGTWRLQPSEGSVEFSNLLILWKGATSARCPDPESAVLPTTRFIWTWLEVPDHFCYRRKL